MSHDVVDHDEPELERLRLLVEQARALAAAGEHAAMTKFATVIWRRVHDPVLELTHDLYDVLVDVDAVYDAAFPPPPVVSELTDSEARFRHVADVLDVPWPTPRRAELLASIVAGAGAGASLDGLAEEAVSAPPSAARTRLLRLLVCSRLRQPLRRTVARVLEALYEADALDLDTVEAAFAPWDGDCLGDVLFGASAQVSQRAEAGFLVTLREQFDEVVWRLTAAPNSDDWFAAPKSPKPRGLRFVLRGLDVWAGRLPAAPGTVIEDYYRRKLIEHLCAAELSGDELIELSSLLEHRPADERKVAIAGQPSLAVGADGEPPRLASTSEDPVGDALAAAGEVVSRYPGVDIVLSDLRDFTIQADAIDPNEWSGLNTALWFGDECALYADVCADGLALALADQPGIEEVHHMDREVVLVRTALSLPDVHAAGIRALLEINRQPRPLPDDGRVSAETMSQLATAAAPLLAEHGFSGALRMILPDEEPYGIYHFYRTGEEQLGQVLRLSAGFGELGGTELEGTVEVHLTLVDLSTADPAESIALVGDRDFPQGGTLVASWDRYAVPPNAETLARVLVDECLPWFDTVNSREAIVTGWVRDPNSQPPGPLWEKLEVAARWGMRDEAAALLRYGNRMEPQHGPKFAAVVEKYQL